MPQLRRRHSLDQVVLLALALRADCEGIEQVQREGVLDGLALARAQIALSEDLHPDYALACRFHLAITLTTVSGSASMCEPMGLTRTRSTSTHGDFAAARSASMVWHEQPCARMMAGGPAKP